MRSHECESCLIGCSQISWLGCGFICCLSTLRPKLGAAGGVHLFHGTGMLPEGEIFSRGFIFVSEFFTFRVDFFSRIGSLRIFREDLFSRVLP